MQDGWTANVHVCPGAANRTTLTGVGDWAPCFIQAQGAAYVGMGTIERKLGGRGRLVGTRR